MTAGQARGRMAVPPGHAITRDMTGDPEMTALIADDHALVRGGIRTVIESLAGIRVAGEAENGLEAIAMAKEMRPGLMTLDGEMPYAGGMEVLGEVRRWSPDTRIVAVTGFTSAGLLSDWVSAGAEGVMLKTCPPDRMRSGLEVVMGGGVYVDSEVLGILRGSEGREALTEREMQILHLIAEGNTNADIAERLSISPKTAENHRTRMMAKLRVNSLAQLLAFALREGLLDGARQR